MRFVSPLTEEHQHALRHVYRYGTTPRERQRAHAVLLSDEGFQLNQIARILYVDRDTVSRWLREWEGRRMDSLKDLPRSGRPRIHPQSEQGAQARGTNPQ